MQPLLLAVPVATLSTPAKGFRLRLSREARRLVTTAAGLCCVCTYSSLCPYRGSKDEKHVIISTQTRCGMSNAALVHFTIPLLGECEKGERGILNDE